MKAFFIITFIISNSFCFSQSRNSLIKDIKNFQYKTYSNALYPTSTDTLKWVVYEYCEKVGYKVITEYTVYLGFVKKIKHPQYRGSMINSYVYIDILPRGLFKTIKVKTREIQHAKSLANYSIENKVQNTHDFNKRLFYQYVYRFFNKTSLKLPVELTQKVERFNSKQTKHKKKIIEGRDY